MKNNNKTIKVLALFWRYGYWLLTLTCVYILGVYFHIHPYLSVSIFVLIDGIYTIVITALSCEHFICGMQNAYSQRMTPYHNHTREWLSKIKREGYIVGILFSVLGLALLIIYLFE